MGSKESLSHDLNVLFKHQICNLQDIRLLSGIEPFLAGYHGISGHKAINL